jgi:hypothetical protein
VRGADHYALGHVPGAINIPWTQIGKPENLAKLPPDKQIVVYCYTGHTGQVAATALNMMGYDAVNLKFGMMGWTEDDAVLATARFDPATQPDYAFEGSLAAPDVLPTTGADPVSLAPVGLVIFGVASIGIGVVGYAVRRRSA